MVSGTLFLHILHPGLVTPDLTTLNYNRRVVFEEWCSGVGLGST